MFFKRTTALAAAAATALTLGAAAPAHAADNDELARILFGALATGLIAHAITQNNSSSHSTTRHVTINRHGHGHRHAPHTPRRTVTVTPHHGKFAVPAACQRRLKTQHGPRTYVGKPCLQSRGFSTASLPSSCARTLDFGGRTTRAWGVSCLAGKGYRLK